MLSVERWVEELSCQRLTTRLVRASRLQNLQAFKPSSVQKPIVSESFILVPDR